MPTGDCPRLYRHPLQIARHTFNHPPVSQFIANRCHLIPSENARLHRIHPIKKQPQGLLFITV